MTKKDKDKKNMGKKKTYKPKSKPKPKPKPKNKGISATFTDQQSGNLGKQIMNIAGATLPVLVNYMSSGRLNLPHVNFR